MAKNTHSQEIRTGTSDSYTPEEWQDRKAMLAERPQLGGVKEPASGENRGAEPSVGNNSAASSESESRESDSQTHNLPAVAPDAENPSEESVPEGSTAHTTDGSTQETHQQPSAKAPRKATAARKSTTARRPPASEDDDF